MKLKYTIVCIIISLRALLNKPGSNGLKAE